MPYIVFEGIDCSGKTTQSESLATRVQEMHKVVRKIHQPGTTPLGMELRKLLRSTDFEIKSVEALETLFQAENQEMGAFLTEWRQNESEWIISDRCNIVSSFAYGLARGCSFESINTRIARDIELYPSLIPNVIFFMDIGIEEYKKRQQLRGETLDRIEALGTEYLENVIYQYRTMPKCLWKNAEIIILDGTDDAKKIEDFIDRELHLWFQK